MQNPLALRQKEERWTKPGKPELSTKMRESEKSKTRLQMNNSSAAWFVAMKGVRLLTDENERRLREISQQDRRRG
jgi:hypothetical protein